MAHDSDVMELAVEYATSNPRATFGEAHAYAVAMLPFLNQDAIAYDREVAAMRSRVLRKASRQRVKQRNPSA